jgi:copper resistance protein C
MTTLDATQVPRDAAMLRALLHGVYCGRIGYGGTVYWLSARRSEGTMASRQWGRLLIATMVVATVTMMSAGAVSAHAQLKTSTPVDKATVTTAPTQVAITFSEETDPLKSGGSVTDASGATVSTGFTVDLNQRTNMTIALKPNLPNGAYTVKWNSFTADDNGVANGTFTFTIQAQAAGTTTTGTAPASGSATAGTAPAATTAPTATVAPTTAPTATVSATATRAATATATGTGGGSAAATPSPTTLPTTGNSNGTRSAPWAIIALAVAAIAVAGGFSFRYRAARR